MPLGQDDPPTHVIAHLSDSHFLAGGAPLHGAIDTDRTFARALEQVEASGRPIDAFVLTGDIADLGETDAYARIRGMIEPVAERLGAEVVWVMGNHDERTPFRAGLLPAGRARGSGEDPVDYAVDVAGLRIVALDSTDGGYHHGRLDAAQLDWLAEVLSDAPEHGVLIAMHHPPLATPLPVMEVLELQRRDELAEVVRGAGSTVRGILAGHMHYGSSGVFAGVPVAVAAATSYTMDLAAPERELVGVDSGQAYSLVEVRPGGMVASTVPIGSPAPVSGFGAEFLARLEDLDPSERIDLFSRKR
ncbi:metallophosphoesterase [Agromyces sp. SYSU T00194]|uniref:metallophosphoesterase n=1 Tax=Agromyces chitinivorans TaxID=3158560 RepID=UPI003394BE4E